METINSCIVYKATKLELLLARTVPYWKFLPLNKRKRVRLRNRFRYAWVRRWQKEWCRLLLKSKATKLSFECLKYDEDEYFWEIKTEDNGRKTKNKVEEL